MGAEVFGDQARGLLRGVQGVQGEHPSGQAELCEQGAGGLPLAALVGDLGLAQDHTRGVVDRADQEDPAGLGAGASQGLAVECGRGQQPCRGRTRHCAGGGAALLAFSRARRAGDDWWRGVSGRGVRDEPQVAASRASASRSPRTRRKVRSLGTRCRPVNGSRRVSIAA
ncbi:hypothetical protein QFZ49_005341 [Streptomyces turgidiscabies]|uniref:Uncharacterized protein n=1 Tax=Streptomyces turgidiscabies TaxID=85558 RepID=A0ABU0RTT7_9ACTN|nr:hypothetical protein [Streptomyces turgidiscabies]MDQ0935369.1 hypothetical protein [Streptomyces turgidiscabies]